jgi:ABC-type transporter MlaC component
LITDSRERVPMDYTLYLTGEAWMVSDLSIEGISLVHHYRDSFDRFLVNKSFAELMKQLERKLGRS